MEQYIEQPIITRHSDHEPAGSWTLTVPKNCGIMKPAKHQGNMFSRTVKFVGKNKQIMLGKEYFHKEP